MSEYIHKSHNVSGLMYHFVCPAKYRKAIFCESVIKTLVETCNEISERYEIHFLEIGRDKDHVHFLIQSTPIQSTLRIKDKKKNTSNCKSRICQTIGGNCAYNGRPASNDAPAPNTRIPL